MNYLFIGAHPDDIEYSCAGTMLKLKEQGHEVKVVIMTKGENDLTHNPNKRLKEQVESFEKLGIKEFKILGYSDGNIPVNSESVATIKKAIDEMTADTVFTHFPSDSHQDHISTARIVLSAVRGRQSLVYYNSYSSINFTPNLYINIEKYVNSKIEILNSFTSQIDKYKKRNRGFSEKALLQNQLNGYDSKCSFAEVFCVHSVIIN